MTLKQQKLLLEILFFPAFVYLYKTLKPPCSKVNNKAKMMYFIGSFEYRVTFLVKMRRFNDLRKWTWAVVLGQIFRQIVSIRVNYDTYQYKCGGVKAYKKGRGVASSCCPSLKNAWAQRQRKRHAFRAICIFWANGFLGGIFYLEYPSWCSEKVNCHFPKLQIVISQTADFHFPNYRFSFRKLQFLNYSFSFRKLQIFISFRSISFRFAPLRFRKLP